MVKQLSPCTKCTERHLACHDSCHKYKEWKGIFTEDKNKYTEDKMKRKQISETMYALYKSSKTKKSSNIKRSFK